MGRDIRHTRPRHFINIVARETYHKTDYMLIRYAAAAARSQRRYAFAAAHGI